MIKFGYGDRIELNPDEQAALALGHIALAWVNSTTSQRRRSQGVEQLRPVLEAAAMTPTEIDGYIASLGAGSDSWRTLLRQQAISLEEDRITLLAIDLCTNPMIGRADATASSVALRRMDAVLDLLEAPFCSVELQQDFNSTVATLLRVNTSSGNAARTARSIADMVSWVHPVIGMAASKGLDLMGETGAGEEDNESRESGSITEIARTVMACRLAFQGDDQRANAAAARQSFLKDLREVTRTDIANSTAHADPVPTALSEGVAILSELAGSTAAGVLDVPDLTNRALAEARRILGSLAVRCEVIDDLQPAGTARMIISDTNWYVASQVTQSTRDIITLRVRKHTDPKRDGV